VGAAVGSRVGDGVAVAEGVAASIVGVGVAIGNTDGGTIVVGVLALLDAAQLAQSISATIHTIRLAVSLLTDRIA